MTELNIIGNISFPQSFWYQKNGKPSVKWAICLLYWPLLLPLHTFYTRPTSNSSLFTNNNFPRCFFDKFPFNNSRRPIWKYELKHMKQNCARDRWCNGKFEDYWVEMMTRFSILTRWDIVVHLMMWVDSMIFEFVNFSLGRLKVTY